MCTAIEKWSNCREQSPSWEAKRSWASQKITTCYRTRYFITSSTSSCFVSRSWSRLVQSMILNSFLVFHFNTILPSKLRSSKWFFPSGLSTKPLYSPLLSPIRVTFFLFDKEIERIKKNIERWEEERKEKDIWRQKRKWKWQRLKTTKSCNLRIDVFTTVKYNYKEMKQPFELIRKQVDDQNIVWENLHDFYINY